MNPTAAARPVSARTTPFDGNASTREEDITCPDPSVHEVAAREKALQDQAATAAHHVIHAERDTKIRGTNPLGPDGRLSAACAAISLKYARAEDLPSFPSVGIDKYGSALSAANLANSNRRSVERWKPETPSVASKAALLANDYKMAPLRQPEASEAGSRAAMLAYTGSARNWRTPTVSVEGAAAAKLAMENRNLIPQLDYGYTENGHKNALLAAKSSVMSERAEPTPALTSAAKTLAGEPRLDDPGLEAARIKHMGESMPPEMFTEHPPVESELEEKRHQDALRASAISFANQLYKVQHVDDSGHLTVDHDQLAAAKAHGQSTQQPDIRQQAMQYLTLQDAAQRLAAERLQNIQTEQKSKAFREYWGYPMQKPTSRLSVKGRNRRRASSEEAYDIDSDDEKIARRVRSQMSRLNSQMAAVDAKRREQDRRNLLATAEKKVQAQMQKLDEQIFNDTGKMSPAMLEEWDAKARQRAKANSEARMRNHGKVHVGGDKYVDRSEIDEVARRRVQPTLDRVTDEADKQRARDEERRLDLEEKKRLHKIERERQAEVNAEMKKLKKEEKNARREEKHALKAEREARKAEKAKEMRLVRQEKRKSKEVKKADSTNPTGEGQPQVAMTGNTRPEVDAGPNLEQNLSRHSSVTDVDVVAHQNASMNEGAVNTALTMKTPKVAKLKPDALKSKEDKGSKKGLFSPTKGDRGIKRLFSRLKRKPKDKKDKKSFAGGAALTSTTSKPASTGLAGDAPASHEYDSSNTSFFDESDEGDHDEDGGRPESRVSGATEGSDEFEEAREVFDERLAPPPMFVTDRKKTGGPVRDTKFHEEL